MATARSHSRTPSPTVGGGTASAQIVIDLVTTWRPPVAPVAVDDQVGPAVTDSVVTLDPRANDLDPDGDADALRVESDDPALTVLGDGSVELIVPRFHR